MNNYQKEKNEQYNDILKLAYEAFCNPTKLKLSSVFESEVYGLYEVQANGEIVLLQTYSGLDGIMNKAAHDILPFDFRLHQYIEPIQPDTFQEIIIDL